MRELDYYIAVSIDGFIADPDGGFDAFLSEGDHMEVVLGEYADALPTHVLKALQIAPPRSRFDTVIMGRNTLAPALEAGISSPYQHLRQFVATAGTTDFDDTITATHDPLATVRELKEEPGLDIWFCGGGELAASLLPAIDRIVLKRNPLVFGAGTPLFGSSRYEPRRFEVKDIRTFGSGVVIEEYAATR